MSKTLNAFSQNSKMRSYSVLPSSPSISNPYQLVASAADIAEGEYDPQQTLPTSAGR